MGRIRGCLWGSMLLGVFAGCWTMPPAHRSEPVSSTSNSVSLDPLARLETSLIFAPARYPEGNWNPPGLPYEDAFFASADGTKLHGWFLAHESPRAVILYCHGNAGNVATWSEVLRLLHDRVGASVMVFDYRGFGKSEGAPSEAGVLADARAARTWLAKRVGRPESDIVVMGRSLGGAVAIDLAANDGARALVIESTFTSMPEVGQTLFPLLPVKLLTRSRFTSIAKIGRYRGPILHSHGTADRLIPYTMGERLFKAANEPKTFVPIPGGDHNDPQTYEYYQALVAFLDGLKKESLFPDPHTHGATNPSMSIDSQGENVVRPTGTDRRLVGRPFFSEPNVEGPRHD